MIKIKNGVQLVVYILLAVLIYNINTWVKDTNKRTNAVLTKSYEVVARGNRVMEAVVRASKHEEEASDTVIQTLQRANILIANLDYTRKRADDLLHSTDLLVKNASLDIHNVSEETNNSLMRVSTSVENSQRDLNELMFSAQSTMDNLNKLVTSSDVAGLLQNANKTSLEVAGTAANLNATSTDFRNYVHGLLTPVNTFKQIGLHALGFLEGVAANLVP